LPIIHTFNVYINVILEFSIKFNANVYTEKAMLEFCLPNLFAQVYRQGLYGESYVWIMLTQ